MTSQTEKIINKHKLTIAKKQTIILFQEISDKAELYLAYDFNIEKWELKLKEKTTKPPQEIQIFENLPDKKAIQLYNRFIQKYFLQ